MCMEQKEETANEQEPPTASEPVQTFRFLLVDALMAAAPLPVMLFCGWLVWEARAFPEFPFIIIGAYLLAGVTMAATAWRLLRGADLGSLRTRCFFVFSASLLLIAPYLVIYWTAGAGGNGGPWWGPVAFVLFMAHVPVLFLELQRRRLKITAERKPQVVRPPFPRALRGNLFICILLSLAPAAGMLHVTALVDCAHGSGASVGEICFRCGAPILACLLLTVLIYLLLKLFRRAVKRFPFLREVLPSGLGLLLMLTCLLLPGGGGLLIVAGVVLWWLLLRRLIRLSTGRRHEWYWWRDSRPACILQSLIPTGMLVWACSGSAGAFPLFILLGLYLLSFCAQGSRGGSSPVRRVLFIFLASHLLACSFMCMCARGFMLSSYALGLAPTAILLLYLLENRSTEQKTDPS